MTVAGCRGASDGRMARMETGQPSSGCRTRSACCRRAVWVLFGAILFAAGGLAAFGNAALYWTSALGGSLDVDAVSLSVAIC